MSRHSSDHLALLNPIVTKKLGAALVSAGEVEGGFGGGSVHLVSIRTNSPTIEQEVIVKLGPVQGTPVFADDDVDARIYVARSWSLTPVHALLRARDLPTYDLLGCGFPSDDVPYFWVVMSPLPGMSVRGYDGGPDPEDFYRVCGEALGALHAVTRPYDGAVDRAEPYRVSWTDAFFASLEHALDRVLVRGDDIFCRHEREIHAFIDEHRRRWVSPREYALSHPDGLQGHARHDGARWRFTGHLDLEDFTLTDARFPLAGYELGAAGPVPPSFWDGYRRYKEIDPSSEASRDLFKLYYLLDWFWIVYDHRRNPIPATRSESVRRHTHAILRTIRGS